MRQCIDASVRLFCCYAKFPQPLEGRCVGSRSLKSDHSECAVLENPGISVCFKFVVSLRGGGGG